MRSFQLFHLPAGMLLLLVACSEPAPPSGPAESTPIDPATVGSIVVDVRMEGAPPTAAILSMGSSGQCAHAHDNPVKDEVVRVADGKLANAVVYVAKGLDDYVFAAPKAAVQVDQRGCLYQPRVSAVQMYQPLEFLNSDREAHNVHGSPKVVDSWNFIMSRQGSTRSVYFDQEEVGIPVSCDIHPWMRSYVSVFRHPYFGVTGEDGRVALAGLPAGEYEIGVWHEVLGEKSLTVSVSAKGEETVAFVFGQ